MMDLKQVALKVVLDQIGEDDNISSVNDRLRIQKAMYLAQVAGINLGYHYSWYVKGPYSTGLTQDYYKLSEALRAGDSAHTQRTLNPTLAGYVPRVKTILTVPADVTIPRHNWYEALASLHFLLSSSGYTLDKAKDYVGQVKPHLIGHLEKAVTHLRAHGLITT